MATLDEYEIMKDLGAGAFSTVKLAKHKDTGNMVALKIIKDEALQSSSSMDTFKTEVEVMSEISHPNIINMLSHSNDGVLKSANGTTKDKVIYLTLELANGGELFDFIAQTGSFSEPVARYYFHQMIDAFEYLHSRGISHRDMKPDNIMLDDEFNLKIADFGFSSKAASNQSFKGTRSYMAPEILIGAKYHGQMVDIFAAGIILFIMITQIPPFQMAHPKDGWYKFVCSNRMDKFWKFHGQNQPGGIEFFSQSFIDLINWIFNFDHTTRPSLAEIKEHDWYKGPVATKEEVTAEFTQRKSQLEGTSEEAVPETNVSQDVYDEKSVHRGVTGEIEDPSSLPSLQRREAAWIKEISSFTKFFSKSKLEDLFACVAQFGLSKSSDYEFSADEYSMTMSVADENENRVKMQVNILDAGEGKHCIEAVKISGDRFQFNDIFKEMKSFFAGHVNAKN
jgi:serine/threonine protein kinase